MKPIYEPKGKAKEYGDYALNIYTGCPHECFYCFAPSVLHREKEKFHTCVAPRENIVEKTKKQIERECITGKLIHLYITNRLSSDMPDYIFEGEFDGYIIGNIHDKAKGEE